jgi:hypothetical protein
MIALRNLPLSFLINEVKIDLCFSVILAEKMGDEDRTLKSQILCLHTNNLNLNFKVRLIFNYT